MEERALVRKIHIERYKSILALDLELDRVTMLIGANGCGKSNVLESIAVLGAALADRLDKPSLALRGIRPSHLRMLKSGFGDISTDNILCKVNVSNTDVQFLLKFEKEQWRAEYSVVRILTALQVLHTNIEVDFIDLWKQYKDKAIPIPTFLIFAPQIENLRAIRPATIHIEPLGVYGEGFYQLLRDLYKNADFQQEIEKSLSLIDWFDGFKISKPGEDRHIEALDRFLSPEFGPVDELTVNEGFLFVLFYTCLLISPNTPAFFAIDNVDAGLNPKLAARMVKLIAQLARKYNKQVIMTTHNPAALDGLNLADPDTRLLVARRSSDGDTRVHRVQWKPLSSAHEVPLSEAFLRGYLGGLEEGF